MPVEYPMIEEAMMASQHANARAYHEKHNRALCAIAYREAKRLALAAYAEELLPALLGGEWVPAQGGHAHPSDTVGRGSGYYRYSRGLPFSTHVLTDHVFGYRKRGARGRLTTKIGAFIGQPYMAFEKHPPAPPTDKPTADALAVARALAEYGFGVWARPDLSTHLPGASQLVVIAADLLGRDDAAAFGFVNLQKEVREAV